MIDGFEPAVPTQVKYGKWQKMFEEVSNLSTKAAVRRRRQDETSEEFYKVYSSIRSASRNYTKCDIQVSKIGDLIYVIAHEYGGNV